MRESGLVTWRETLRIRKGTCLVRSQRDLTIRPKRPYARQKIQSAESSSDYRAIGSYHAKPFPLGGREQLVNKLLVTETHNLF